MLRHRPAVATAVLLTLIYATSLFARSQVWNFLGYTRVDGNRDHGRIEITRSDRLFRTIRLRITGEAIFFDRIVIHFGNGTSQELAVGGRISPEGKEYVVEFPGNARTVDSLEFWYYKEHWDHNPSVSLYGCRLPGTVERSATERSATGDL